MKSFNIKTSMRTQFVSINAEVQSVVNDLGVKVGIVTVFIPHTTAGITINENADPDVVSDMTKWLDRIAPWDAGYRHAEGNSAAHFKASLMGSSVNVIVEGGRLKLGTWQDIYLCEFDGPRSREVWVR